MRLHNQILIGLLAGLTVGIGMNLILVQADGSVPALEPWIAHLTDPIGQIFLRLLFLIVVPLVFSSLALGVANLGEHHRLGRIGGKTIGMFVFLTITAVLIGLFLVQIFEPGKQIDSAAQARIIEKYGDPASGLITRTRELSFGLMTFVDMILPKNILRAIVDMQMLPTIMLAFLFGTMMRYFTASVRESCKKGLEAAYDFSIRIVDLAMRMAPFAVPCLVFGIAARFGFQILGTLGLYVLLVFAGYLIHLIVTYSLLIKLIGKMSPLYFFQQAKTVMITAFSTSSSSATLPTTIKISTEDLKLSPSVSGFVLPLGATINMNGTALYEGLTVLFIGQIFGIDLSLNQQILVVLMTVITAIGTAGIPGGSLPMIILVMQTVGIPAEGIGIILGVDRLLDMGRTVVNVTGDMATAVCIAQTEKTDI